jgi:glycosyltransferase involved in cell wall biosynthesis
MPGGFAMLLGGFHDDGRAADVAAGRRPANDVHVLVDAFDAEVFDFRWLGSRATWWRRAGLGATRRLAGWSAALAVRSALVVRRYGVVYVSGEDVGVFACALSRLIPGRYPLFVVRIEQPVYGRTKLRRFVHRSVLRFASARIGVAICRTSAHADLLRRTTRIPPERVVAFGQEIDTSFFDPEQPAATAAPDAPAMPAVDGPYVLSAGLERRDYATLLDAVDGMPVSLVIAAASPWSKDGFDVQRELPGNVVVGAFDARQMRELYRRAEAVVLSVRPTDRACGMNVVGEAWAMARPVIASATGGLSEFITPGKDGVLVPPGEATALRTAILDLLADRSTADRLARAGQSNVRDTLSLDQFRGVVADAVARTDRGRSLG